MSIMSYRTGRTIYAEIQTRTGSGLRLDYPFIPVSGFFKFSLLFSFSKKLKFSVCVRFSLFNLIICNDSLSFTVTFKCSFTLLVCCQWETNSFFVEGEKNPCFLCSWNFWIVASGNADTFNEEINMFVFYSVCLWMERRASCTFRVLYRGDRKTEL